VSETIETSGQTEPYENIIDFKSRGPWTPPEPEAPSPRDNIVAKEPDRSAIEHLKGLIRDFKAGKHHGIALMAGCFDERGNLVNYRMVLSDVACAYPISFGGAVEQMKLEIAECAVGLIEEGATPEFDGYDDDDLDDEDLLSTDD
jgi:hypothetical protein